MKPDVRSWKTNAKEYIPRLVPHELTEFLRIKAEFTYDYFYKNGKLKTFDTPNMLKVLIDAVAEKCGFDDKIVKFGEWGSEHSDDKRGVKVTVEQVAREVS